MPRPARSTRPSSRRRDRRSPSWRELASPQWIAAHVDEVLAVCERLYTNALYPPVAREFLDRMAWLPALIAYLSQPRARLDA